MSSPLSAEASTLARSKWRDVGHPTGEETKKLRRSKLVLDDPGNT